MKTPAILKLASNLSLPLDVAGQTLVILGIRGSGKTNTAGSLAEELLDQHQPIAVIDPTDAWWGLRAGRDGSPAGGYQVFIFGGAHGDIPLHETDGRIIAEFLVRESVSVILSLRHLRKAAQRRFVTEFCEELYHLKGKPGNGTPLTVFIDEAPLFVPQKVIGEVARTVGAVEDLIARGRNTGFGVVLISQRSATLNADVRTQADTMLCHRVTASLDRKAIADWFEENASTEDLKKILASLATLKNGEAWVWAPPLGIMERVQMRMRRTFDSSATPKAGTRTATAPKTLADVDIEKLKRKMTDAVEEKNANDPAALKKRIAELERAAANGSQPVVDTAAIERSAELRGFDRGWEKAREYHGPAVSRSHELAKGLLASIEEAVGVITAKPAGNTEYAPNPPLRRHVESTEDAPYRLPQRGSLFRTEESKPATNGTGKGETMSKAERKCLTALAQYPAGRQKTQIAILTGYAHNGGGFNNALSALRSKGYAAGSAPILATASGINALGSYEPLPSGRALAEHWMTQLSKAEKSCLQSLIEVYPRALSKPELAKRAGYEASGGGFNNALSRLRTLELISGRGDMTASEDLF